MTGPFLGAIDGSRAVGGNSLPRPLMPLWCTDRTSRKAPAVTINFLRCAVEYLYC